MDSTIGCHTAPMVGTVQGAEKEQMKKSKPFKLTATKKPPKYEKEWQEQRKLFDHAKAHEA